MKLAEKILALRKKQGMSQEELAEKLDVSRQAVSRWEMGTALPDASNILHLSKLFDVTADYLLNDDQEEPHSTSAVGEFAVNGSSQNTCRTSTVNDSHENGRGISSARPDETMQKAGKYRIPGWCVLAAGFLGNFIIYILSRMHKVMVPRITYDNESGQIWYQWSSEFKDYSYKYFVSAYNLELLTTVFWGMVIAGFLFVFILPFIRRKAKGTTSLSAENGEGTADTE